MTLELSNVSITLGGRQLVKGLDLASLCRAAQQRLEALQQDGDPESCTVPVLESMR